MGIQLTSWARRAAKRGALAFTLFVLAALTGCDTVSVEDAGPPFLSKTFSDCPRCPQMVVVPAGRFIMGSPHPWHGNSNGSEGPPHLVIIARPFAVGVYEVTFDEWNACVAEGDCNGYRPDDSGWGRGDRPAINLSWEDAKVYTAWLSAKTSEDYRLLTESEWEYAARAGTVTRFWWGHRFGSDNANCFGCGSRWDNVQTAPVGSFLPNGFGLYDMMGNAREWVEDCWHGDYLGASMDGEARSIAGTCGRRVTRGGAWLSPAAKMRSASRAGFLFDARHESYGFRVAKTLR